MTRFQSTTLSRIDRSVWHFSPKKDAKLVRIGNQPIIMVNERGDRLSILGDGSIYINEIKQA